MALAVGREALRTEGDVLVEPHPAAEDGGLADHDAGAVVDETAFADLRAGVDVDAGVGMREFSDHAGDQRHTEPVELMRQPVADQRMQPGVAEQHLVDAARRGVALEGGGHVAVQQLAHRGQPARKGADQGGGGTLQRRLGTAQPGIEAQLQQHLLPQPGQRYAQGVADVMVFALGLQVRWAQPHREQRAGELLHHAGQQLAGRQLAAPGVQPPVRLAPAPAGGPQAVDDVAQFVRAGHQSCTQGRPWKRQPLKWPRCWWSSLSPSKPSWMLKTFVRPALVAASAARAERLPLRHSSSTGFSLPDFGPTLASSSLAKRGLRFSEVPVAQATCRLPGTWPTKWRSSALRTSTSTAWPA
mmetsp:Transcript_81526/g.226737  ORF Transcript_81526/g.226737 Transcript_81526/m.226737 type:complete len:357 (-) Transcript_81526:246-1316(-)